MSLMAALAGQEEVVCCRLGQAKGLGRQEA
jgi:hypothetical protein